MASSPAKVNGLPGDVISIHWLSETSALKYPKAQPQAKLIVFAGEASPGMACAQEAANEEKGDDEPWK